MTRLIASGVGIAGRLQPTHLEARAGDRIAVIGPNGGGKTSLLRALAGTEEAQGSVRVDGHDLTDLGPARSRYLSYMSASRDLGWAIPIRDLVRLGVASGHEAAIAQFMDEFELGALADRPVNRLSTGERARALMVRAVASASPLILLDEPLSNLDPYWVLRFLDVIDRLATDGSTVLCAVHDLGVVSRFDRTLLVADGRVQADGIPADVLSGPDFEANFRVAVGSDGQASISPAADRRSSR